MIKYQHISHVTISTNRGDKIQHRERYFILQRFPKLVYVRTVYIILYRSPRREFVSVYVQVISHDNVS